jgi:hypothetical protein
MIEKSTVVRYLSNYCTVAFPLETEKEVLLSEAKYFSVADPGSWIRCLFDPGPGSGIRNRFFSGSRISDPGSRIPTPYFLKLSDKFLGKKFYNSLKTGPNFFRQHLKN